ncbi:MBL fold metallo-hydrolase [Aerolutibacter ruishenii]|uniref:Glyoxylase-like metal-dependent hydrolase (Beta-lactamase superfamily II) n=1 Tax=Aerolutibacter ruishenii TaxID=686800 RepID=A0A562LK14_9GAMM|nr:MBL fold metallo-hydrolase [Lysobacter ruishenii]TWI07958.1 glyoxylase-like metal-dependent hydrolase (beta-lactamase superfamily II) [Lysobacter ruishenii]
MNEALNIEPFFHDGTGTWSYVVHRGADAVVIDPVLDYDARSGRIATDSARHLLAYVVEHGLTVHRILETHAHADHLTSAAFLRARTGAPVAIGHGIRSVQAHFADLFQLTSDDPALHDAFDALLEDGEVIESGALRIEVLATPGHTADSLSYRIDGNVFVGDTVFAPDIGTARCDFPGGSVEQLYHSVQRLYAMPDEATLWLCHDYPPAGRERRASVSVGEQKRDNRMLDGGTSLEAFAEARHARDAGLPAPNLLYPSLQVNIRGGRLPAEDPHGRRHLSTPLRIEAPADGLI